MKLQAYLTFENALEASHYYEALFDARLVFRQPGNPAVVARLGIKDRAPEDITLHGILLIAGNTLTFADNFVFPKAENAAFLLTVPMDDQKELAALEALWEKVAADSSTEVLEDYQPQDFGGKEGFLKDKYGIRWHFVAEPDLATMKQEH
jgi:uncharacterized glyoxalase superfamily protein PhnB